jgi:hypothetical protein
VSGVCLLDEERHSVIERPLVLAVGCWPLGRIHLGRRLSTAGAATGAYLGPLRHVGAEGGEAFETAVRPQHGGAPGGSAREIR